MSDDDLFGDEHVRAYRETDGERGYEWRGTQCLLLTTIGRKSGEPRTMPLIFAPDEDRQVIVASKGGAPEHPEWYHNLVASGDGSVELGTETFPVTVKEITGPDRDRIYDEQARRYPGFAEYAQKTAGIRTIPVLELRRG